MIGRENETNRVAKALAGALKIGRNSLCFCGSGKKFKKCCGFHSGDDLMFLGVCLDAATAYKKSQGGNIKTIPGGIWKKMEEASLERFICLYPECRERAVGCHLIPENILRSNYGGHCREYKVGDNSGNWEFIKMGIGRVGVMPVFCSPHDSGLFRKIDDLKIDFSSKEQLFLLAFKAIAFSLRKTQYLLGINSQIEIVRPFLIQQSQNLPNGSRVTIDISGLQEEYIRFTTVNDFLKKSVNAYENQNWNFFSYFHRNVPCVQPIFFAGFLNPSRDLNGKKINHSSVAIAMTCNIFSRDDQLHILLSCPGEPSKTLYQMLLKQLGLADEGTFMTVINNFLSTSVETLLLPEDFPLSMDDLRKINAARKFAAQDLRSPTQVFDLKNPDQAVKFI